MFDGQAFDVQTQLWCVLIVVATLVLGVLWVATKKGKGEL